MKGSSIEDIIIEHTEDQFTKSEIEQIEQVITEVLPGVEIKITLAEDKENQRPFINQLNEVAESKMQEQARLNKEEAAAKALAEAARIEAERVEAERVKAEQEAAAKAKAALSLLEEEAAAAQAALQAQMQNEKAARLKAEEEARIKAEQEAQAALSLLEEEEAPAAQSEIQDNAEFEEEVQPEQVIFTQHPSDLDYYTFPDVSAVGQPAEAESTGCCCVIS